MPRSIESALVIIALLGGFAIHPPAQAQQRSSSRTGQRPWSAKNRPPRIESFTPSSVISSRCPFDTVIPCTPSDTRTISLIVKASDPDGNSLRYKYSVTGGSIIGDGANVIWDVSKADAGSYQATVSVSDSHGATAKVSTIVKVVFCDCQPSCITVTVEGASDAKEGQTITFTASVSGGPPSVTPIYNWTVTGGKVINGLGTPIILVETFASAGDKVEAVVKVGGFAPECANEASVTTQVREK